MARSGHWAGQSIHHWGPERRHACARGPRSERPRQCTWPRGPQLGKQSGHVTPERKCRSSWETQAHSWEQGLGAGETDTPHQSTGELGEASWQRCSHAETADHGHTHKDCILPTGPPIEARRVWASVRLFTLPLRSPVRHMHPSDQRGAYAGFFFFPGLIRIQIPHHLCHVLFTEKS